MLQNLLNFSYDNRKYDESYKILVCNYCRFPKL